MTSKPDRQRLLQIAREAIVAHVNGPSATTRAEPAIPGLLLERTGGAFVSLHLRGELRGCIGHLEPGRPLARIVCECAVAACSSDPRFQPVAGSELQGLEIELSLLGPLEPISSPEEIDVGRHGVVVEQDGRRGLLLPQVATEWQWDRETFVAQTCRKAGLPRDAWRHGARLWRFEAEVFSETQ